MVESGKGLPNFSRATPPISFSSSSRSWPKPLATSSRTQMAWDVTSGPIPSPGREVTRSCMEPSIRFPKDKGGKTAVEARFQGAARILCDALQFPVETRLAASPARIVRRGKRDGASPVSTGVGLHAPEIIFLLAVMIGERDRYLCLAGAAGYMSRMRVIGIGGGSGGPRERQGSRGGREFLAVAGGAIAVAWVAVGNVLDQFDQMAVLNLFDAVGKDDKPAIDLIEMAAFKLVSQLLATQSQRVAAGVLAQHQSRIGHAHRLGRHDFVGQRILEHAILVNSGLVRKRIPAGDGLVGLHGNTGDLRQHLAGSIQVLAGDCGFVMIPVGAHPHGHDDFFERRIAGALADAVDGALHLTRPLLHSRE